MASTLGHLGRRIISAAPIPSAAIPQLRTEFGDELACNPNLDTSARLEWITSVKKVSADNVSWLCRHQFSIEEINKILDAETRRGPIMVLLSEHDENFDAVSAIVAHRHGCPAAEYLVGTSLHPQPPLLRHIAKMKPHKRAALLAALSPDEMDDDTVVEHLLGIEKGLTDAKRGSVGRHCTTLFTLRPGLATKLLAAGAPDVTLTSLAQSPWLTDADVDVLLGSELSKFGELALAGNPWVDPTGSISTKLSFSTPKENLARRLTRNVTQLHANPFELDGDELVSAVRRSLPSDYKPGGRPALLVLLAQNPNLQHGYTATVGSALSEAASGYHRPPQWALDRAVAAYRKHYSELGDLVDDAEAPTYRRQTYAAVAAAPVAQDKLDRLYVEVPFGRLATPGDTAVALFARFAEALGDDPQTWVAAALLADNVDGSLFELAELAAATS